MESQKKECFDFMQDFQNGTVTLDWTAIFEDEDLQGNLNDALSNMIYHIAVTASLDEKQKVELIGKIVLAQAELAHAVCFAQKKHYATFGKKLETLLKQLIKTGTWYKDSQERFDLVEKMRKTIESGKITAEQTEEITPVLLLFELANVVNSDQEQEDDEADDE